MGSFFLDNATADFLFIRPSGNPLDAKGFENMWSSGDLVLESAEITKVHKFELLGSNAAICIFTLSSKFTFKGTQNVMTSPQLLRFLKRLMKNGK